MLVLQVANLLGGADLAVGVADPADRPDGSTITAGLRSAGFAPVLNDLDRSRLESSLAVQMVQHVG